MIASKYACACPSCECRETIPSHWWDSPGKLLAGKDKVSLGSWLCASPGGRIAFVTNVRNQKSIQLHKAHHHFAPSRGNLPVQCTVEGDVETFLKSLDRRTYPPFNLVVADLKHRKMWFVSNENEEEWNGRHDGCAQLIGPGIHALSNQSLNSPWPKVERAKREFQKLVHKNSFDGEEFPWEELFGILGDSNVLITDPSTAPNTGYNPYMEIKASGIFVSPIEYDGRLYGTRSMIVIAVKRTGSVEFKERYLNSEDNTWSEEYHSFVIQ